MVSGGIARRIALRYFFSKKSHSVINLISMITIVAIAVPTASMILLLSVHNGFQDFIARLWSSFDPPLVIELREGSYFDRDAILVDDLMTIEGVAAVGYYIEENVLLRYKERQSVVKVRGVDQAYLQMTDVDKIVIQGSADLSKGLLLGAGVSYSLGTKLNLSGPITMIAPSVGQHQMFNPSSFYQEVEQAPIGVFMIDAQRDGEMVFCSLEVAEELFSKENKVTSIAVTFAKGADENRVEQQIQALVGDRYTVKNIYEQNELEYKLVRSEKVAIYLIILLVMIVASLTLIGTILILIIEKNGNNIALRTMGLTSEDIRKIFIYLGMFVALFGTVVGMVLGLGVSLAQQYWGFVPISGASLLIDRYPIKVMIGDSFIVAISVLLVTFVIAWISCRATIDEKF